MSNATREQHIVLKSIHIKQLKGLKNCEITFDGPLTAIMGVNGIGKSTIIHALSCCFRKVDDYGEERRFSSFFPPSTNATWKNSSFTLNYNIVDDSGTVIRAGSTDYEKAFDRWAPKYDRQQKKNIRFLGIDTCMPDIERYKEERYYFKTTERTDKNAQKIIEGASIVLNKDYASMTSNQLKRKEMIGVITGQSLKYSSLSMGAGEQRVFRIMEAIINAPIYSLILIDEIDLLLHSDALKRLVQYIYSIAERRYLQVVFTTHSLVMSDLKQYVSIKYLDWYPDKVDVYDGITSLGWRMLSGDSVRPLTVYVEDDLSEAIVKRVARDEHMLQKVRIGQFGAADNAFTLAASYVMQGANVDNILIILDGDRYRTEEEKQKQIKKKYSGSECGADEKRNRALSIIKQYNLPDGASPEFFLHSLLCSIDDCDEIIDTAQRIQAVSDSHDWINQIAQTIDDGTETIMAEIINACSDAEGWDNYVSQIREWLVARNEL